MDDKELIKSLRDYAKLYVSDNNCSFNPGLAIMVANRMEQLVALAENGQSAIDTNMKLIDCINRLQEKAESDIKTAINIDDYCLLCKHYIECEGKNCDCYQEGLGCTDENGNYHDWAWSCEDFNWGECPKLENTPCNGCDFTNNFEWRGAK